MPTSVISSSSWTGSRPCLRCDPGASDSASISIPPTSAHPPLSLLPATSSAHFRTPARPYPPPSPACRHSVSAPRVAAPAFLPLGRTRPSRARRRVRGRTWTWTPRSCGRVGAGAGAYACTGRTAWPGAWQGLRVNGGGAPCGLYGGGGDVRSAWGLGWCSSVLMMRSSGNARSMAWLTQLFRGAQRSDEMVSGEVVASGVIWRGDVDTEVRC